MFPPPRPSDAPIRVAPVSNRCEVPPPLFFGKWGDQPMQTDDIDYHDDAANLRGYLAFDEKAAGRRPGVLVFHEGLGLGDFAMARARMLGGLGYVAFAADIFGEGRPARKLEGVAKPV